MHSRNSLVVFASCLVLLAVGVARPAHALDDDPHGGVETGTHPSGELHDPFGGAGSGPITSDPGTLVVHEKLSVYPDTEDSTPGVFRTQLSGMSAAESNAYAHAAGHGASDSSAGGDKKAPAESSIRNSRAGRSDAGKSVVINVLRPGGDVDSYDQVRLDTPRDLTQLAKVEPITSKSSDGTSHTFAYLISFTSILTSSPTDTAKAIFRLTGGLFDSCLANANAYVCTFATPKTIRTTRSSLTVPGPALAPRQIPICSGVVKDGGYGSTTVISVADVDCDAAPGKEPVRLEVSTIHSDLALGIPTAREGDGSVIYSAPKQAEGTYVSAEAWAVAADGTYSLPFSIAIRNRYAPAPVPPESSVTEANRGVETVIPASRLFSDVDVDQHGAESGDHLTSVVTGQGAMGGAWFDAVGDLHYQSIDVIRGDYTDHVTVQATDAFGLRSPERRLSIHITDIVPGCATGGTTTDATTPVRIELHCWITPQTGWRQIDGLHYRITEQPEYGTVSDLDPDSGVATYTPDPAHPGPIIVGFTAENNGAARTAQYAIDVLTAP
ncbi:hypothetical protein B7R21_08220 [Subtercola boreus]|uniref:Cadherin domain-containing protein n=1 Tax=Subtercola boreus TaxID=120213 RepID=A0A3E0VV14_9MICO|nr:hypothetical protein [Subtercola boreus]RFA13339.1 hypothetical protein B7R21_08220 [Subtercola boreus]